MSAPTINANAAIFLNILRMIGSFPLAHSSFKPKQSPTFYLLKQLNNSCAQIDNFSPISPAWYRVTPPGDVRFGSKADICNAKCHVRFTGLSDCLGALRQSHAES
jgi:hypothetical protein